MSPASPADQFKAAINHGDAAEARRLLGQFPEIRPLAGEPWGPFNTQPVVRARSREMLDVLLEAGADINARSGWWAGGFGLMDFADPDLAEYAMTQGGVVDVHAAARLGKLDTLRDWLDRDPALVSARGGDGQTPLHFAANVETAALLLERGADVNARDIDHESTPAQYMARERQDVARFLIRQGGAQADLLLAAALGELEQVRHFLAADPGLIRMKVNDRWFPKKNPHSGGTIYNWTLGGNKTPPALAREFGHHEVFDFLWSLTPGSQRLAIAASIGDAALVGLLLEEDPELPAKLTPEDFESLVLAAQRNDTAAVKTMLHAGWPPATLDANQASALHWSCFHGNRLMVETLLESLAKSGTASSILNRPDREFHSPPIGWAMYGSLHGWHRETGDYPGTVRALLNAGAAFPENPSGTPAVLEALAAG